MHCTSFKREGEAKKVNLPTRGMCGIFVSEAQLEEAVLSVHGDKATIKREKYNSCTPEQRALIGKYASKKGQQEQQSIFIQLGKSVQN